MAFHPHRRAVQALTPPFCFLALAARRHAFGLRMLRAITVTVTVAMRHAPSPAQGLTIPPLKAVRLVGEKKKT